MVGEDAKTERGSEEYGAGAIQYFRRLVPRADIVHQKQKARGTTNVCTQTTHTQPPVVMNGGRRATKDARELSYVMTPTAVLLLCLCDAAIHMRRGL